MTSNTQKYIDMCLEWIRNGRSQAGAEKLDELWKDLTDDERDDTQRTLRQTKR